MTPRAHTAPRTHSAARWLALAILAVPAASATRAQTSVAAAGLYRLAADEQTLWLAEVHPRRSAIYCRTVNEPLAIREGLNAALTSMAPRPGVLYAVIEDGSLYSLRGDAWSPELNLPARRTPLSLLADDVFLYALVASPPAGELPHLVAGDRPATSQPFDPDAAPFSVLRHDPRGWAAVAPAPLTEELPESPRLRPCLGLLRDTLGLLHIAPNRSHLRCDCLDPDDLTWRPAGTIPELPNITAFWITTLARVPTLIVATGPESAGEELHAWRLLGDAEADENEWRRCSLELSPLPAGVTPREYRAASGFNQHVALLVVGSDRKPYLRFGRPDAAPTEDTHAVAELLAGPRSRKLGPQWLQTLTLLILLAILLVLFVFRRNAMVTPVELPAGAAVALSFQRLVAMLIDLTPFLLVSSYVLGIDWRSGLRDLSGWAIGTEAAAGRMPNTRTLAWWALGTGCSCTYCLIMELLTQRTIGKLLMSTRVLTPTGQPAGVVAILVRNIFRFVELQPPLWVLGFLVVLSRNRQRVGDVFARTIVARRAPPANPT